MAQTYTVKSGDTLGKIAGRYGTSVGSITGYRSGNPNLIYPGEVLTIGGGKAPTGGGGGGSVGIPGVKPLPKAPTFTKASQFTGAATKEVAPLYDPQIQTTKGQLPLLQKRYDLYLANITTAGERREGELQQEKATQLAGIEAGGRSLSLRGTAIQSQKAVAGGQFEKLISTLVSDMTAQKTELGIDRESSELELRGMIASLVGQKASKIMELSRTLSSATNEQRMQAFNNLFKLSVESFDRSSELHRRAIDKQQLDISRQKLARETMSEKKESALDDFAAILGSKKNFQRDMSIINNYLKNNPAYKSAYRTIAYSLGKGKEFDAASKPPKKAPKTETRFWSASVEGG